MLTRLSKNVVCVKEIPSNLIEEAFFILKANDKEEENKNEKKRKEIVMLEIDDLIDEYAKIFNSEIETQREKSIEAKKKLRKVKLKTLMISIAFVLISLIIVLIKL